jgi:general secretion pathway protein G
VTTVHPATLATQEIAPMESRKSRVQRGMTLIEIMVVLVIIGLVASAVAVNVVGRLGEAKVKQAETDVRNIASQGVDAYRVMRGRYPTTEEGLGALISEKFIKANKGGKLLDPWNREYIYLYPGQAHPDAFDVKSYGADGQPGGEGENADIVNP